MSNTGTEKSIACTLNNQELRDREQYARGKILPHAVRIEAMDAKSGPTGEMLLGIRLEFEESSAIREQIEIFVAMERQCCGFLSYTVTPPETGLTVIIEGPKEAKAVLDTWVAHAREAEVGVDEESAH